MVYLALLGMLMSILFLAPTPICGTYCTDAKPVLINILPYIGIAYFTAVIFLQYSYKKSLTLLLPAGLGFHMVLFIKSVLSGAICSLCLVVLIINALLFLFYVKTFTKGKSFCYTTAVLLVVIFTAVHLLPVSVAILETENVSKGNTTNSVGGQYRDKKSLITVYNSVGPVVIDVSKTPVLLWAPHCNACKELLKQINNDFNLVAVWVNDKKEFKHAKEVAAKYNKDTFYVKELPNVKFEGVPAVVRWDEDRCDFMVSIGY